MSDQKSLEEQASAELAQQLKDKPVDTARADAIAQEDAEDIDAFLADLEGGAEQGAASASAPAAADDPFAAAFAELEALSDDEPAPAPAVAIAPQPQPKPAPQPKEAAPPEPKAEIAPPKDAAKPKDEPAPQASKDEAQGKKVRSAPDSVPVVEKVRSPGFRFAMWALKSAIFFTPVLLLWWIVGAYTSTIVTQGWLVAILATLVAFVVPMLPRFGLGKGRYAWWAFGIGVLGLAALVAPMPSRTGRALMVYGHWPTSTVAQLAGWRADHLAVRGTASAAALIGRQVQALGVPSGADALEPEPKILGTGQTLAQWGAAFDVDEAKAKQAAQEKPAQPEEKPAEQPKAEDAKPAPEAKAEDAKP